MNHAELLANLLPPVAYDPNGPRLEAEIGSEGMALDRVQTSAEAITAGIFPATAGELISDWERVCGLTPNGTFQERIANVRYKLVELGGLSIPYFVRLGERIGYAVTITEPAPYVTSAEQAAEQVEDYPDVMYRWQVNVLNGDASEWRFYAGGSVAGERLCSFGIASLEELFRDLKPAHTECTFSYVNGYWRQTESGVARITESGAARMPVFIE